MRFQLLAARMALAALVLAVLLGAGTVACVRLGLVTDGTGSTLMIPAVLLGVAALVLESIKMLPAGQGKSATKVPVDHESVQSEEVEDGISPAQTVARSSCPCR